MPAVVGSSDVAAGTAGCTPDVVVLCPPGVTVPGGVTGGGVLG